MRNKILAINPKVRSNLSFIEWNDIDVNYPADKIQGAGPETLVAIAVERSLEMIIGLLAILKAERAYVPLDPTDPEDRLQFMLEGTKAPLLITQAHLKERFKDYVGKTLSLQLDTETKDLLIEESPVNDLGVSFQIWTNLSTGASQDLPPVPTSHNLAYVIYTSDSTGKLKEGYDPI